MSPPVSAEGRRIGPYECVRLLGAGGMGEVWEAVLHGPTGFRKRVALKLLLRRHTENAETLGALQREARLGARLQHPNLVGTLGLSEHDGVWVVAMELVQGASVIALLRAGGALAPRVVLDVGQQAAAGLAHVHDAGLVHRDVKPANLMVDRSGLIKVGDLGISMVVGAVEAVAGTFGYMAPEQAEGHVDPRSDLFALGATLFVLATGRRPFGRGKKSLLRIGQVERLLASRSFLDDADAAVPGLGSVLYSCLRRDPDQRWPDARRLMEALAGLRAAQVAGGEGLLQRLARARPGLVVEPTPPQHSDAATQLLPSGNVPAPRDRFVGRTDELRQLCALVEQHRHPWLVLVGPGGMGKTRLSLEVARITRAGLSGGAWAFDLSEARTEAQLCAAVARVLGLDLESRDPVAQLGRVLAKKGRALVLLDNLEQCLDCLPSTVGRWLEQAPAATFLGTSRIAPELRGERVVPLGSLPLTHAVSLFRERASRPLAPTDESHLEPLCAALEGLPLAIELAAARVKLLGVERIRERLSLSLLAGGGRALPHRHRSLTASLDWSAELLTPVARGGLAQLSVFDGGFTLEASEAVLEAGAVEAIDLLEELVDASLLRVDHATGRFSMLVVVAEYASTLLDEPQRVAAERRHGLFFAQLGSSAVIDAVNRADDKRWTALLTAEVDNLRAACRRALDGGDADVVISAFRALWHALRLRGPIPSALGLARRVAHLPGLSHAQRAEAQMLAGDVLAHLGDPAAQGCLEAAVEAARSCGDRSLEGRALGDLGRLHHFGGRLELAGPLCDAALELHRATGDRALEGRGLMYRGSLHRAQGEMEQATALLEQAIELFGELGERRAVVTALISLGGACAMAGRVEEAQAHFESALSQVVQVGGRHAEVVVLSNLATLAGSRGRLEECQGLCLRALDLCRELGSQRQEANLLGELGMVHRRLGRHEQAREAFGDALEVHRAVGDIRMQATVLCRVGGLACVVGRMDDAKVALDESLALAEQAGEPHVRASALGCLGELAVHLGRYGEAREHFERVVQVQRQIGNLRAVGIALGHLGEVHREEQDIDGALACFREELALQEGRGDLAEGAARLHLGQALLDLGRVGEARPYLDTALPLLQGGMPQVETVVLVELARLCLAEGDLGAARRWLDAGEQHARSSGSLERISKALVMRARLLAAAGMLEEATEILAHASEVAGSSFVGQQWAIERARQSLGLGER